MTALVRARISLLLAGLLVAVCGHAADANLVVGGAWIRQPPPGTDVAALYFSLQNAGTETVQLIGAESSVAAMAMLHQSAQVGGQSTMRALTAVPLKPGASVAFAPGGRHVMLHGLTHPLQVGERVPVTLLFAGGIRLHVLALVRPLS